MTNQLERRIVIMNLYVDGSASSPGNGTREKPFQTITEAAKTAHCGDQVLVAPGIYREYVDPVNPGVAYRSLVKGGAVITGAQPVKNWIPFQDNVWKALIPNEIFTDRNPYTTLVEGDWFIPSCRAHTGEVYLNEKSLYEVTSLEQVLHPEVKKDSWDPDFSVYTWYTEQMGDCTVIYANFQGADPNRESVEINVRPFCFYPSREGVGQITLSGFTLCRAATQWAPPTAEQEGLVGPHWSKGWIIEDCEIYQSKCCGISLGKYLQPENDNKWLKMKYKEGAQTEREAICQAWREGWTKEKTGGHIIRRCQIHHCGQTGIAGHLGGAFSLIEDNHIHHINNKRNLSGAEIAGIKLHAAIDVIIRRNHIHHCTRGLWLDWQAQGTRVTRNVFHDNTLPFEHLMCPGGTSGLGEDIFIEVSHGPTLIDHNLLLSERSLKVASQGIALVHNLIAGSLAGVGLSTDSGGINLRYPRYTPYHVPHSTDIAGFMFILHGDMRFYNNVFIQQPLRPFMKELMDNTGENGWDDNNLLSGTWPYNGYRTEEEWKAEFEGYCGMGSPASDRYILSLPVWSGGNCYFNGARPWEKETDAYVDSENKLELTLEQQGDHLVLKSNLFRLLPRCHRGIISTETLGRAIEPEESFEKPDGTPIVFDRDFFGNQRGDLPLAGPFEEGAEELTLWKD